MVASPFRYAPGAWAEYVHNTTLTKPTQSAGKIRSMNAELGAGFQHTVSTWVYWLGLGWCCGRVACPLALCWVTACEKRTLHRNLLRTRSKPGGGQALNWRYLNQRCLSIVGQVFLRCAMGFCNAYTLVLARRSALILNYEIYSGKASIHNIISLWSQMINTDR